MESDHFSILRHYSFLFCRPGSQIYSFPRSTFTHESRDSPDGGRKFFVPLEIGEGRKGEKLSFPSE